MSTSSSPSLSPISDNQPSSSYFSNNNLSMRECNTCSYEYPDGYSSDLEKESNLNESSNILSRGDKHNTNSYESSQSSFPNPRLDEDTPEEIFNISKISDGNNINDQAFGLPDPGDKTGATQLMNGAVNYSITTTVHEENVFNYGQFINAINFGLSGNDTTLTDDIICGHEVILQTDTAAMYLSEYESTGTAVNSQLILVDATKILDYDGEHQDIPYGQIDADGSGNIHASLRFTGRAAFNNGRKIDSCNGKDVLYKTDTCRKVDWHVQFRNVINLTMNHKADSCGNVYVVGAYEHELHATGSAQRTTRLLTTRMKQNMFLAKVDCCGKILWAIDANDRPNSKKCTTCTHQCSNVCSSSSSANTSTNTNTYTSNSNTCNKKCNKCPKDNTNTDNYVDAQGLTLSTCDENPILTGSYSKHVTFEKDTLTNEVARANAYVAEFTCEGCFVMMYGPTHCPRSNNTSANSCLQPSDHFLLGESIDVDANDEIYFTGTIKGRFRFDKHIEPETVNVLDDFNQGMYISRISRGAQEPMWSTLILANVPPANSFFPNIDAQPDGNIYHAAQTQGKVSYTSTINVILPTIEIPGSGTTDLYSGNISSTGTWLWTRTEVGTVNNAAEHLAANSGFSHVAGSFIVNQTQVDPFVAQSLK